MTTKSNLLEDQIFYELMQSYRFAPMTEQANVINAYEAVKMWIIDNYIKGTKMKSIVGKHQSPDKTYLLIDYKEMDIFGDSLICTRKIISLDEYKCDYFIYHFSTIIRVAFSKAVLKKWWRSYEYKLKNSNTRNQR